MAKFKYTVKDTAGKTLKGTLEADSRNTAVQSLREKGFFIISLEEEKSAVFSLGIFKGKKGQRVKIDDLVIFSRQLATMVDAGIPLVNALDILAEQTENMSFKQVVSRIRDDVETGSSLSEALSKHAGVFSGLFINLVKAGESSGMLDEILDRVAMYLEKTSSLQRKIKAALVYPAAVTIMAIAITVFLMIKVVPVFKDIYSGFGATLPLPTQIMINVSDFLRKYFYITIIFMAVIGFAINRYTKTENGKVKVDSLKLHLPIFGILLRKVAVGKFTRTLSTLIKSGVPILNSLDIVSKTAGNRIIEKAVDRVAANVREGESIADPLARSGVFPPMVVRMISVGEQTGELEKMLSKIADFYDEQVDAAVSGLTSLIEPLIIAFLGIVIGGIVICMFMPILQISQVINT
ncbi:MAG: type II secretion system F family protein [Candidatus Omnitrophica bacterium]|nr:type II secretion system F family protein [Candidatus Omnitrophota bacterium]